MNTAQFEDLRASVLGAGAALVVYYGYAVARVAAGDIALDRPVTWLGIAGGVVAIGWAMTSTSRRRAGPRIAR